VFQVQRKRDSAGIAMSCVSSPGIPAWPWRTRDGIATVVRC
jgi:hypothetical protein